MPLKILVSLFALVVSAFLISQYSVSRAEPLNVYPPPTQVTVQMYELDTNGSPIGPCSSNSEKWGCTAFCNNTTNGIRWNECAPGATKPYPYSSNTPSVPIESDYLLDVIAHEAWPDILSAVAVEANAIAARSFTYGHIQANSTIDNSTSKHVFVPYRFERLNPTVTPNNPANVCSSTNLNLAQQKVCTGVARRYYVSYGTAPNDDFPAITEYFTDIPNATVTGTAPYEISVADPISSDPAIVQLGHGRGMSQNGASRWGYGNMGYRGNLTPWSVQWTKPEHILFHYYTGVHLRDANNNNARLSPDYRWNPLAVNWGGGATLPPNMQVGTTYNVAIQLQNTGAVNWGSDVRLSCQWKKPDGSIVNCQTEANPGTLIMGSPAPTVTLPVRLNSGFTNGIYTLMIDMKQGSTFFHNRETGKPWPTLNYKVCAGGNCRESYLPIIMKNWMPIIPCGGSTVYPAGQPYCTDRNGAVRSCNAQNANGSTGEPNNLFTNDIYYRDYPAPGVTYYYLNLPGVISGTGTIGLRYAVHSIGGSNEQHLYFEVKNPDTGVWSTVGSEMYHGADPPQLRGWGFSGRISAVRVYVLWTNGQYYQPAQVDYIYVMCN